MKNQTLAQQARDLLEPVSEEQWIKGKFTNGENKCCAIGHLNRLTSENPDDYSVANCTLHEKPEDSFTNILIKRSSEFLNIYTFDIAAVNNGLISTYSQSTPKERTMALLTDMVEAGY